MMRKRMSDLITEVMRREENATGIKAFTGQQINALLNTWLKKQQTQNATNQNINQMRSSGQLHVVNTIDGKNVYALEVPTKEDPKMDTPVAAAQSYISMSDLQLIMVEFQKAVVVSVEGAIKDAVETQTDVLGTRIEILRRNLETVASRQVQLDTLIKSENKHMTHEIFRKIEIEAKSLRDLVTKFDSKVDKYLMVLSSSTTSEVNAIKAGMKEGILISNEIMDKREAESKSKLMELLGDKLGVKLNEI